MALASGSIATTALITERMTPSDSSAMIPVLTDKSPAPYQYGAIDASISGIPASSRVEAELPRSIHADSGMDTPDSRTGWETEEESLPPVGDDACFDSAESIQARINWHETVDNDTDWAEIEINLPTIRRGTLRYSGLDEELLLKVSGLLEQGTTSGSVPAGWLDLIADTCSREEHRDDLRTRMEMLLGELEIQVIEEVRSFETELHDGDPLDLPIEVLEFLEDIGSGAADPLDPYYRELAAMPLLTKEEEQSFGRMWQKSRDPRGINGLVEGNLRFVIKEARKFRGLGLDLPDLISEGNLGLITAAMRFDPERENRFLTYAAWWIRQAIFHALAEQGQIIRLPAKVSSLIGHLERKTQTLNQESGLAITQQKIAESLLLDVKAVDRLQQWQIMLDVLPITECLADYGVTGAPDGIGLQMDAFEGDQDNLDQEAFLEQIDASMASMNDKERTIVSLHFGIGGEEPLTLEQIGRLFEPPVSRERIRQIEERAFERIRTRRREVLGGFLHKTWTPGLSNRFQLGEIGLTEWEWDYGSE